MRQIVTMGICSIVLFLFIVLPASSQTEPGVEVKDAPRIDPDSLAELVESLDFLSTAKSFSFTAEIEYDAFQGNGQKIEFGGVHNLTVVRPDKLYADITSRDGTKKVFIFDGKNIYFTDVTANVYASVPRPGDINQAIDYFTEDLQMPLPLGQIISTDVSGMVKQEIYAGGFVEQSTINGVLCDHLTFRTEDIDFQVWIASEGDPLQMRLVIDYKDSPGSPQFRAMFKNWNFKPAVPDSLFVFKPGDGMQQIAFAPILRKEIKTEVKEGEKK